jgi:hypothetical protein
MGTFSWPWARDELRQRIARGRDHFDTLARHADPDARCPRSAWNVQQTVAHVLTIAHRYRDIARTGTFHAAATVADIAALNQIEMDAATAPIAVLVDQLRALDDELNHHFDVTTNDGPSLRIHAGAMADGITMQTNWLGELLFHGDDIARAVKTPWELPERDMLLVARGILQLAPWLARVGLSPHTDISVAFKVPQARPYLIHIHHSAAEVRELRATDRPDAILRLPATTFTKMLYRRISPVAAARHGLRIIGGRRPWRALHLSSSLEQF